MITDIQARNIKGQDFKHELGDLTLICGENFAGKTARLEAIRLAIAGYTPEVAKTNQGIWELAGDGPDLMVSATVDGTVHERRWFPKGGSIKIEETQPARRLLTLDPDLYFGLSADKQVEYILRNSPVPEQFTEASILADLSKIESTTELGQEAKTAMLKLVQEELRKAGHPSDGIRQSLDALRLELKTANADAKAAAATLQTLAHLKNQDEAQADVQVIRKQITELEAKESTFRAAIQQMQRAISGRETEQARRETFEKQRPIDYSEEIERLNEQLKDIPAGNLLPVVPTVEEIEKLQTKLADVRAEIKSHASKAADLDNQINKIEQLECCPFCKSDEEGWRERVLRSLRAERKALGTAPDDSKAKAALEKARMERQKVEQANEEIAQAMSKREKIKARLRDIEVLKQSEADNAERIKAILSAPLPEAPTAEQLKSKADALNAVLEELREARDQQVKSVAHQQDRRRLAETELLAQKADARVEILKAGGKRLLELGREMVTVMLKPVLETANMIVGPVLTSPLDQHEGEIGMFRGTKFITVRTMSGSERAVTFAAICAALSSLSDFPILILDELNRLTRDRRIALVMGIREAITKGLLKQAILIVPGKVMADDAEVSTKIIEVER